MNESARFAYFALQKCDDDDTHIYERRDSGHHGEYRLTNFHKLNPISAYFMHVKRSQRSNDSIKTIRQSKIEIKINKKN